MIPVQIETKSCIVCGGQFGRNRYAKKMENRTHFRLRQTCSTACRYELIASKRRGKRRSKDVACSVTGCLRLAIAKTLCNYHWSRNRHGLPIEGVEPKEKHWHSRHRLGRSPEYTAWASMIDRCSRRNRRDYKYYGGRGIVVCHQWKDFRNFLRDVGLRPSPKHSIDRIDNDGNYEPGNVRWATRHEQHRNMSSNRYIEFGGIRLTMKEWSIKLGINYLTLKARIDKGRWPLEKALTLPVVMGQKVMRSVLVGARRNPCLA